MNFETATDTELSTLLGALADHARRHDDHAAEFEGKEIPEGLADMPASLRAVARDADRMRNDVAGEMHRRGRTGCSLAHPGHGCPHVPAIGN